MGVFPLRESSTNLLQKRWHFYRLHARSVRRSSAWWLWCRLSSQSDLRPRWMFYFPARLCKEWSDEPAGALLLHCATHAVQVARVWRQRRVHLLTAVSQCRSNQDAVETKKCVEGKSVPLSFPGFEACFFQARLVPDIFYLCICAGSGLSYPLHLHIKAKFLFPSKDWMVIFLQSRNPTFLYLWPFEDACAALQLSFTKKPVSWRQSIAPTWRRTYFLTSKRQPVTLSRVGVPVGE